VGRPIRQRTTLYESVEAQVSETLGADNGQ
jgi:hypothetical protein